MTVDECIREYERLGGVIFGRWRLSFGGIARPKYSSRALENLVEKVAKEHDIFEGTPNYNTQRNDDDLCKWFVSAVLHRPKS